MHCKIFTIIALFASAFLFTACDSDQSTMVPREANVLGIVKYEPASYGSTGPNTFAINTSELYTRKEFSGDKTTFFWGLVTIKDY